MTFLALTGFLNFIGSAFLGTVVLIKKPRRSLNRHFFYLNFSIAFFSIGYFFWQMSYKSSDAMAWFKILCAGIILINVKYLHYVFDLVDRYKQKKMELAVYYFINAIFIFMNFNSLLYSRLEPRFGLGLWPNPTMLFHVYLAFWLWECVYGLILLLRNLRVSTGMKKEQIKYSIVAACIAFIGGAV